ncbi:MAG: tyrosine-type recombinase/integrase [bacterium]
MDILFLCEKFCDHSLSIKGFSKVTIKRYRQVVTFYSNSTHTRDITQVTEDSIRNFFYNGRTERNWSPNTFLHYHKSLLVFFRWCIKEGYIQKNPVQDIEVPKLHKKLPPKLTQYDTQRLLEVVYNYPYKYRFLRYRNHAIFSMFIHAGLRKQELLKLKLMDVDIENFSIFIRQGKGNKDRVVPMSQTLAQSLIRYLEERHRLHKTCPEFFTSLNHNLGFTQTGLKNLIEKIRTSSGIFFTAHKLRHTFATLMLEGGVDIYSLGKMLGHADIKTTTIYLYASAEHLRGQMAKHPLNT